MLRERRDDPQIPALPEAARELLHLKMRPEICTLVELFDDEDEYDPFEDVRPGHTPDFSGEPPATPPPAKDEESKPPPRQRASMYPVLFDRQNREGRYLAKVLGDALIKGLTQVAKRRPADPIGYLATYLYQYAARRTGDGAMSRDTKPTVGNSGANDGNSSPIKPDKPEESEKKSPEKLQPSEEKSKTPLDVVNEDSEEYDEDDDDLSLEFEDHTKMKDEEGQTVLHFAASRLHPEGSFRGLLSHAEVLLGERDSLYRTCRDAALDAGHEENVESIDGFVWDAHLQQRTPLLRMLLHEGYDHLLRLRDASGRELQAAMQQKKMSTAFLREAADFVKRREELHGCIRNNYLEGVCRLVKGDAALVTAKGTRGRCGLHVAVLFQHTGIVNSLVKANAAAVYVADNLGRTPLHYAMAMVKVDQIAKILITAGALKNTKDVRMRSPSYFFIYKDEIRKLGEEEARLS